MKEGNHIPTFSEYLLSFTHQDFNKFRQEEMIRIFKLQTTPTPSTTKLLPSHTSRRKTKLVFLPHCMNLFDESVCESTEENPLHLYELKSPPSSLFQSSSNLFELPKPTKTSIPNQPCGGFCLRTKKITIEDPRKVRVVHPNPHSTICSP